MNDTEETESTCILCGEQSDDLFNKTCEKCLEPSDYELIDKLARSASVVKYD